MSIYMAGDDKATGHCQIAGHNFMVVPDFTNGCLIACSSCGEVRRVEPDPK